MRRRVYATTILRMKLTLPLLAACAVALLGPAAAQAGTVSIEGDTLVYRGDAGADSPFFDDAGNGQMSVVATNMTIGAGCEQEFSWGAAYCTMPSRVVVELGAGDDGVGFSSTMPAIPVEVYGGEGKDRLKGYGATNAYLDGGAGNDTLEGWLTDETLIGGPGDDEIQGSGGADHIEGGDGNDLLKPDTYKDPAPDYVDGGNGIDTVDDWTIPDASSHPPVSVTMDGIANDGRPGEGDNVINVEKIESRVSGTLSGGDGDDEFRVWANIDEGNSTVFGNGGNDKLTLGDYQDTVDGGPGNDVINAGFGNDTVTGGPGQDTIFADATTATCGWYSYTCKIPFGNDTVYARDGEADQIDCGVGTDVAYVDAIDTVANCETVHGAGSDGGGPGPGGDKPSGPQLKVSGKLSIRSIARKGLTVTVPCGTACKVSAKLVVKNKTVASGSKTLLKAGDAKVKLKAKRSLKRLKKATATLKVTVEDANGKTSSTKKLKLKR